MDSTTNQEHTTPTDSSSIVTLGYRQSRHERVREESTMEIIRRLEHQDRGWFTRYVSGLNLFRVNAVEVTPEEDPRIAFFKHLSLTLPGKALFGSLSTDDDDLSRCIPEGSQRAPFARCPIDVYGGTLYCGSGAVVSLAEFSRFQCWYVLLNSLADDSLMVLGTNDLSALQEQMQMCHPEESLEKRLLEYCDFLVTTESDGWGIEVSSRTASGLDLTNEAVSAAVDIILNNAWFLANKDLLHWDETTLHASLELPLEMRPANALL